MENEYKYHKMNNYINSIGSDKKPSDTKVASSNVWWSGSSTVAGMMNKQGYQVYRNNAGNFYDDSKEVTLPQNSVVQVKILWMLNELRINFNIEHKILY